MGPRTNSTPWVKGQRQPVFTRSDSLELSRRHHPNRSELFPVFEGRPRPPKGGHQLCQPSSRNMSGRLRPTHLSTYLSLSILRNQCDVHRIANSHFAVWPL